MRVAICDDDQKDIMRLKRLLEQYDASKMFFNVFLTLIYCIITFSIQNRTNVMGRINKCWRYYRWILIYFWLCRLSEMA